MKYSVFFTLMISLTFFYACGGGSNAEVAATEETATKAPVNGAVPNETVAPSAEDAADAASAERAAQPLNMQQAELQNKLRGYSGDIPAVAPFTPEQIKDLMPDKLAGLFVYENEGETSMALGAPATFVVTIYRENYNIIKVAVTDTGGAPATIMAAAQWANQNINRNSDQGFDRTTTYKGYPAHEQYNNRTKVGMFEYIIDDRYIVSCQGKNRTIEQMRTAMDELNLDRLKSLKKL